MECMQFNWFNRVPKKITAILILLSMTIGVTTALVEYEYHFVAKTLRHTEIFISTQALKYSSTSSNDTIKLTTRAFVPVRSNQPNYTETDAFYESQSQDVDLSKTALLLIDVWENHPNSGWLARAKKNIEEKLSPLVLMMREHGVAVIHAPHGQKISQKVEPLNDELVLNSAYRLDLKQLDEYLRAKDITTLFIAGYASNMCIFNRNVSIANLHDLGYKIIFVRDASIAIETPESLEQEWAHKMAVYMIEINFGATTTVDDIKYALER